MKRGVMKRGVLQARWGILTALLAFTQLVLPLAASAASSKGQTIERGAYLVRIGGCNDCHTDGYGESGGKVSQAQWLTGSKLGWNGPWGTTYAANLRQYFQKISADEWVRTAHAMQARPPMPWWALHAMTDQDLRALRAFVVNLGPAGAAAPAYLPPGQEPSSPVIRFPAPPAR